MALSVKWDINCSQSNPNSIACFFKKYWLLSNGRIVIPDEYYDEAYIIDVDENYKHIDDPFNAFIIYYDYASGDHETQHIMYAIMQSDSYDELDAFRRLKNLGTFE